MAVSRADREHMARLAAASAILLRETGWADAASAREVLAIVNAARVSDGRVAPEEIDVPDELDLLVEWDDALPERLQSPQPRREFGTMMPSARRNRFGRPTRAEVRIRPPRGRAGRGGAACAAPTSRSG